MKEFPHLETSRTARSIRLGKACSMIVLAGVLACMLPGCASGPQHALVPLGEFSFSGLPTANGPGGCTIAAQIFDDQLNLQHFGLALRRYSWIAVRVAVSNQNDVVALKLAPERTELVTKAGPIMNSQNGELRADLVKVENAQRAKYIAENTQPAPKSTSADAAQAMSALVASGPSTYGVANYLQTMSPTVPSLPPPVYGKLASKMEALRVENGQLAPHGVKTGFLFFKVPANLYKYDVLGIRFLAFDLGENKEVSVQVLFEGVSNRSTSQDAPLHESENQDEVLKRLMERRANE